MVVFNVLFGKLLGLSAFVVFCHLSGRSEVGILSPLCQFRHHQPRPNGPCHVWEILIKILFEGRNTFQKAGCLTQSTRDEPFTPHYNFPPSQSGFLLHAGVPEPRATEKCSFQISITAWRPFSLFTG